MNFEKLNTLIENIPDSPELILPDVDGMSSAKVRLLLNKIVGSEKGWKHLEVGSYKGSTILSSLFNNFDSYGVAFENFCEYSVRNELHSNISNHKNSIGELKLYEEDFFKTYKKVLTSRFNSFFYDGDHSAESQKLAIEIAYEICTDNFIFIVDDWNLNRVRWGTWNGIHRLRLKNFHFFELHARYNWDKENYHNGLGVFWISK